MAISAFDRIQSILSIRKAQATQTKKPSEKPSLTENTEIKTQDIFKKIPHSDISNITLDHKIDQIKTKPDTNKWITKVLLFLIYAGVLAGIIGIGGLLPHLGVNANLGILGISQSVSIGLISAGAFSGLSLFGLYLASKKSAKANEYFKDFCKTRSDWFIDSNLNDLIGTLAFLCLAMTFIHTPWIHTVQGCLNYPFGALFTLSGIYQGWESFKELKNASLAKDKEKMTRQIVNIFNSFLIIGLGITGCFGLYNKPYVVALNLVNGTMSLLLSAYLFYKFSYKTYKDLKNVDENDPNKIIEYLRKTLPLTQEERIKINDEITTKYNTKESCQQWLDQNIDKLQQITKEKLNNEKNSLEEMQKIIIQQEISNAENNKLDDYRSLVDEKTYLEILAALKTLEELEIEKLKLIPLFANIKKQIICKMGAEMLKCGIFLGFMLVPGLNMLKALKSIPYDYSMALLSSLYLGINLTPRFRNIPPAVEKKPLDINKELNSQHYYASTEFQEKSNAELNQQHYYASTEFK